MDHRHYQKQITALFTPGKTKQKWTLKTFRSWENRKNLFQLQLLFSYLSHEKNPALLSIVLVV